MTTIRAAQPVEREAAPMKWTREQYYAAGEAGVFTGRRVELIGGTIVEMAPQKNTHAVCVGLLQGLFTRLYGDACWVRMQLPLRIKEVSEPEPDVAVVTGSPRDYDEHPDAALLVVEASDSTLAYDRGAKASLYAAGGIEEYWVVNLIERVLEVYRSPMADAAAAFGAKYGERRVLGVEESVEPMAWRGGAGGVVLVKDVLP
ncbi:MAG: Uma2 family endonuclease [Planctomycetota bacterium]